MPRVTIELTFEGGDDGVSAHEVVEEFLADIAEEFPEYVIIDHKFLGSTLTQDELDVITFKGESGKDD